MYQQNMLHMTFDQVKIELNQLDNLDMLFDQSYSHIVQLDIVNMQLDLLHQYILLQYMVHMSLFQLVVEMYRQDRVNSPQSHLQLQSNRLYIWSKLFDQVRVELYQ